MQMKLSRSDLFGATYILAISMLLLSFSSEVAHFTSQHANLAGFFKFALLASFGECMKNRITSGSWKVEKLFVRAVIWGIFGIWISWAFVLIATGVEGVIQHDLWTEQMRPFSMSVWMNIISGYPLAMMFVHFWLDQALEGRLQWPWQLFGQPETARWAKIVFISLVVFWVPAHTFTFSLPPHLRVLCAAYLSIALGLILSFAARSRKSSQVETSIFSNN